MKKITKNKKKQTKTKTSSSKKVDKSIAEFVGDIEKDRMAEQEHEIFFSHVDHAEIEKYVREYLPVSSDDDIDNFSYWYGQN